jgi:hypothetical protein
MTMNIALAFRNLAAVFFSRPAEPETASVIYTFGPKRADDDEQRLPERDESFYWAWFMHGHC